MNHGRPFMVVSIGAGHMQIIANPLAEAIVTQFPGRF